MSRKLISLSPDLKRLQDEGYDLEIRNGFLLVKDVPYVNSSEEVKRGILVTKLILAGDVTDKPDNHVAYFQGEHPCHANGTEIEKIKHGSAQQTLAEGVTVQHSFSAKPLPEGNYPDFYAKVSIYVAMFAGPARQIDPLVTAKTEPAIGADNLVHELVEIRSTPTIVEILHKGTRVASHLRSRGRGQTITNEEHRPKSHRAHLEWTPSRMVRWAESIGPNTARLFERIMNDWPHPEMGYRGCLGIIRLAGKYSAQRVEAASERALLTGACRYKSVESILKNSLDQVPPSSPPPASTPPHDNIRGSEYFE